MRQNRRRLFQADCDVALALRYPTDLRAISAKDFDGIARHGYEIADAVLTMYSPDRFPRSFAWIAA
jgi:NTE family protein